MPRIGQRVNFNTLVGGMVSDANPINPPDNVVRTLINMDVEPNGKGSRRLGLEPEDDWWASNTISHFDLITYGVDVYKWKGVGDTPLVLLVIRVGQVLQFFDEGASPLSSGQVQSLDISGYATTPSLASEGGFQITSGKGTLFCTGEGYSPFFVKYDPVMGTWTHGKVEVRIRDFDGVDDGLGIEERPATLTAAHKYNLINQGWRTNGPLPHGHTGDQINAFKFGHGNGVGIGVYPSNADIATFGDNPAGNDWVPALIPQQQFGNTRAPNGHFIIDPFNVNTRSLVSGINGLPLEPETSYPKSCAFYAGRLWLASSNGRLFYSKIIRSEKDYGKCYQEQDPTAQDLNELLDTDGGVLSRPEIGQVERMSTLGKYLVLFCDNGIWAVSGGGAPFTATNQELISISKIPVDSYRSIVEAEGRTFFWSESGIYFLQEDPATGYPVVSSVTDGVIQEDFNQIPTSAKKTVIGTYDRTSKKIYWAFNREVPDGDLERSHFPDFLIYNTYLNAFSEYQVAYPETEGFFPRLGGIFFTESESQSLSEEVVTSDSGPVSVDGGELVTVDVPHLKVSKPSLKCLLFLPKGTDYKMTFGQFSSRKFKDWASLTEDDIPLIDGSFYIVDPQIPGNYVSIVETLPFTLGEPSLEKQSIYLHSFFNSRRSTREHEDIGPVE